MTGAEATTPATITTIQRRVDYSETDQQGVVYHARYVVWLDVARTEHLRATGRSYRDLEALGYWLMVSDLTIRYRRPAVYDDTVRVRAWVRDVASRSISFGYAIERDSDETLLATATTTLLALSPERRVVRLPAEVLACLTPIADPVRL